MSDVHHYCDCDNARKMTNMNNGPPMWRPAFQGESGRW